MRIDDSCENAIKSVKIIDSNSISSMQLYIKNLNELMRNIAHVFQPYMQMTREVMRFVNEKLNGALKGFYDSKQNHEYQTESLDYQRRIAEAAEKQLIESNLKDEQLQSMYDEIKLIWETVNKLFSGQEGSTVEHTLQEARYTGNTSLDTLNTQPYTHHSSDSEDDFESR